MIYVGLCHSERSEESLIIKNTKVNYKILCCTQDDK